MAKKISTLDGQKHTYESLVQHFQGLGTSDISAILGILGVDQILDDDGNLIPAYTLDISSDKPTFLVNDFTRTLVAKVYNYFSDVTDQVTSFQWTRDSGNIAEDTAWAQGKTSPTLNLTKEDFGSNISTSDVTFGVSVMIKNTPLEDNITFSVYQEFSKIQIKSTGTAFVNNSPTKITLSFDSSSVIESQKWFVDGVLRSVATSFNLFETEVPSGEAVEVKLEAIEFSTGNTLTDIFTIVKVADGADGAPGIPGVPGADGTSTYTWIKYAEGPNGENMNEYPFKADGTPREYIGLAHNKTTATESQDPDDYTWTKYIGDSSTTWIKYSQYPDGRDTNGTVSMYDVPFIGTGPSREDMVYLGLSFNNTSDVESDIPEDYMWSKIKGEDGHTGYVLELSNDNTSVSSANDGTFPFPLIAFSNAVTTATLYYGNDIVPLSEYGIELTSSVGITYSSNTNNTQVQITGMTADVGSILFTAYPKDDQGVLDTSKPISKNTFTINKLKNTAVYEISPSTTSIKVTKTTGTTSIEPEVVMCKVIMNTGDTNSFVTTGRLTYRYIFQNTLGTDEDGTEIGIGTNLTISTAGDPLFLEFKYFHPITNLLVDRERIAFVRDGQDGISTEQRFQKTANVNTIPALVNTDPVPAGWSLVPPAVSGQETLWFITSHKKADGTLIGTWSNPVILSGPAGAPGAPGIQGTAGPVVRLMEWAPGGTYYRDDKYIDYIYYRSQDTATEGWYTVKEDTATSQIANASGSPDLTKFQKEIFSHTGAFGTIIAEQANLAGFIFRNQILKSQAGNNVYCENTDRGYFPNLTLDGINGLLKFGDRMIQNKDGIVLRDDCGRDRMAFQWIGGVPVLKFYNEAGVVTWEAGQNGYIIVTSGTIAPTWGTPVGFSRISTLPVDPNITFGNAVYPTGNDTNANIVKSFVQARTNQEGPNQDSLGAGGHVVSLRRWFNQNAMPSYPTYSPSLNNGGAELYNKGDMSVNSTHYEGYYITQFPITMGQEHGAPELLPDGWYMMEGITGGNGQEMVSEVNPQQAGTYIYSVTLVYMKNGNIFTSSYVPLFKYQP